MYDVRLLQSRPVVVLIVSERRHQSKWPTSGYLSSRLTAASWSPTGGSYVWPNPETDELENLLYEQSGFLGQSVVFEIAGCRGAVETTDRHGAEWIR